MQASVYDNTSLDPKLSIFAGTCGVGQAAG